MPKKPDDAAELSQKLLHTLGQQRSLGAPAYPLTLTRLAELAPADTSPVVPTPELVLKAIKKKPFNGQVLLVQPKALDSPLALLSDLDQLAASPMLLEYVVRTACTPANPTVDVAKLKTKVPAPLRPLFMEAVARAMQENTLPAAVGVVTVKKKPHLHWKQWPLPRDPVAVLAEGLIAALQARRQAGAGYPATVRQLADALDPAPSAAVLKQAVAQPAFAAAVALGTKDIEGPAALADDRAALAGSDLLLTTALTRSKPGQGQALTAAELKKQVAPTLAGPFADAVVRRLEVGDVPAGLGRLWRRSGSKKEWLLFSLADVATAAPPHTAPLAPASGERGGGEGAGSIDRVLTHAPSPPSPAALALPLQSQGERGAVRAPLPPAVDFSQQFAAQFDTLNRAAGGHNLVSLIELRRALPLSRPEFDAGLHQLRRAGHFVLKLAEGRHGVSPAEQEAGIVEDGRLLLYVARRLS